MLVVQLDHKVQLVGVKAEHVQVEAMGVVAMLLKMVLLIQVEEDLGVSPLLMVMEGVE